MSEKLVPRARIALDIPVQAGSNNRIDFRFRTRHFSAFVSNNQLTSSRLVLGWTVRDAQSGRVLGWLQQDDTEMETDWLILSAADVADRSSLSLLLESDCPVYLPDDGAIVAAASLVEAPEPYRFCLNIAFGAPNDEVFVGDHMSYREGETATGDWFHNKFFRWCKDGFSARIPSFGADRLRVRINGFFSTHFRVLHEETAVGDFVKSHTHALRSEAVYEIEVAGCSAKDTVELRFVALEPLPGEQMDLRQLFAALHRLRVEYYGGDVEPTLGELFGARDHWADLAAALGEARIGRTSGRTVLGGGVAVVVSSLFLDVLERYVDTASLTIQGLFGAALGFRQAGLPITFIRPEEIAQAWWDLVAIPRQIWAPGELETVVAATSAQPAPVVAECQHDEAMFTPRALDWTGAQWLEDGCTFFADALLEQTATGTTLVGEIWSDFLTLCRPATGEVVMYGQGTRYPIAVKAVGAHGPVFSVNGTWFANYWCYGMMVYRDAVMKLLATTNWTTLLRLDGDENVAARLARLGPGEAIVELSHHGTGLLPVGTGIGRGFALSDEGLDTPKSWPLAIFWAGDGDLMATSVRHGPLAVDHAAGGVIIRHPGLRRDDNVQIKKF